MSPLPHFFGLDFSGAGPWLVAGFLAGLFLGWLWRALRGSRIDAKAQAQINQMQKLLDGSRSEHQADVTRLLGDARNFEQALADAERRAAAGLETVARLKTDVERLSKAELATRNEALAADSQLAKLKSSLQWAESQARGASQDREALEQQIIRFRSEQQTLSADIATAKTASELKDAEIERLINQVQWHESRSAAFEREKQGLLTSAGALAAKDAEIAQLSSAMAAAKASLANLQSNISGGSAVLDATQAKYDQAWKDLTYMRNLAYWQTSEIDRLRKAITQFEVEASSQASAFAALSAQHAHLKTKLGRGARSGRAHVAHFRRQGTNGTSADAHGHARGPGKIAFLHRHRTKHAAGANASRARGYKLAKAIAAANPADRGKGQALNGHALTVGNSLAARRVAFAELQSLKAKVAALSHDAAMYRRLRDALDTANRIANPPT